MRGSSPSAISQAEPERFFWKSSIKEESRGRGEENVGPCSCPASTELDNDAVSRSNTRSVLARRNLIVIIVPSLSYAT